MEHLHDFITVDNRLQQSYIVFLLQVGQFLAHQSEVLEEQFLADLVLRGDIRLAERHQVFDILAGIIQKAADGRIGHLVVGNRYRAHVQVNQFLHILHLHVKRQHESAEYLGHHPRTYQIMVMEGPADGRIPALRLGLADIVHQRTPAEPEVIRLACHIVEHLEGVIEIVLMRPTVLRLHDIQGGKFWQNDAQEARTLQIDKAL